MTDKPWEMWTTYPIRISEPKLADAKTADLVMELLSRGFAVLKVPESGVPEALLPE